MEENLNTNNQPSAKRSRLLIVTIALSALLVLVAGSFYLAKLKKPINNNQVPSAIINITDAGYVPQTIKITKGQSIIWYNRDSKHHQISADPYPTKESLPSLSSNDLSPNGSYVFTFENDGTYTYHDQYYPYKLKGTVIVK